MGSSVQRNRLIKGFFFLFVFGFIAVWQVFTGYIDSSTVKKEKYLIKFDLNSLEIGEVRILHKTGLPLVIMRRSKQDLKNLLAIRSSLSDPDSKKSEQPSYARNYHRSLKPEFFIAYALTPRIGHEINYRLTSYKTSLNKQDKWFGGFSESRTGYLYDKAGRSYKQRGKNLFIPNYKITPQNQLYVYTLKELDFD